MKTDQIRHVSNLIILWGTIPLMLLLTTCESFEPERVIRLTTGPVSGLTSTSVYITGTIGDEGGQTIVSRGICYNTETNPTLSNSYTVEGSGMGDFTSYIEGLVPEVTYYARAYATSNSITLYGNEIRFVTSDMMVWQKSFGGSSSDKCTSATLLPDGSYMLFGLSGSNNGDVTENHDLEDVWILRLTASGQKNWQRSFGGSEFDESLSSCTTNEGGYATTGATYSDNGDITFKHANEDIWVLAFSPNNDLGWQRTIGGSEGEWSRCIRSTSDGGYIIAGTSMSSDGDVASNHGSTDCCIIKLDEDGAIVWQKSYGGSGYDDAFSIRQTPDGGYILAATAGSTDYDVPGELMSMNFWLMKLTVNGDIVWNKAYGGNQNEIPYDIILTSDGGYLAVGYTLLVDGDVTGKHGGMDVWVLKLNNSGNMVWQKTLGGSLNEEAHAVLQTPDGGYLLAASSISYDGDITDAHGKNDFWIVKINGEGDLQWQKSYGGSGDDIPYSLLRTAEGEYLVAGYSNSTDGDVASNKGDNDYWVIKFGLDD